MIKSIFLLLWVLTCAATNWIDGSRHPWLDYKGKYGHLWREEEDATRFKCFAQNMKLIETFNKEANGEIYGLNHFSHLCHNEFSQFYKGLLLPQNRTRRPQRISYSDAAYSAKAVDWRAKGAVTPVKDQGQCGSCWAFSAVGNMEGLHFLQTGKLVQFSEEELVQCSMENNGCQGGLMDSAFDWVAENGGITTEDDYPYTSRLGVRGRCNVSKEGHVAAKFTGHVDVEEDEKEMAAWVAQNGPLSIAVQAGPRWQLYTGGIKTSCLAGQPDHGVLVVGFGEEDGVPYWIVKNSWGASWGEDGYIRLKRGVNCNNLRSNPCSAMV